jgi:hypothetical protein
MARTKSRKKQLEKLQNELRRLLYQTHRQEDVLDESVEDQKNALLGVIQEEKAKLATQYQIPSQSRQCEELNTYLKENFDAQVGQIAIDFGRDLDKLEKYNPETPTENPLSRLINALPDDPNNLKIKKDALGQATSLMQYLSTEVNRSNAGQYVIQALFSNPSNDLEKKLAQALWLNTQTPTGISYAAITKPIVPHLTAEEPFLNLKASNEVKEHQTRYQKLDNGNIHCRKRIPFDIQISGDETSVLHFNLTIDTVYNPNEECYVELQHSIDTITPNPKAKKMPTDIQQRIKITQDYLENISLAMASDKILTQAEKTIQESSLCKKDIIGWKKLLLGVLEVLSQIGIKSAWIEKQKHILESKIKTPELRPRRPH